MSKISIALTCLLIVLPILLALCNILRASAWDKLAQLLVQHRRLFWGTWVAVFGLSCLVPVLLLGYPLPAIHDEFSYLLGADTFARGRWTNPALLGWENFETLYVQQQPSYASIYPPGSAVTLAIGQVLFGHPFWALFLVNLLLAWAWVWALEAWVQFPVALLSTIVVGGGVACTYWTHGYWGGSLAALLGTLVFGSFGRVLRGGGSGQALLLGITSAALGFVRPFESIWLVAGVLGYLLWKERRTAVWGPLALALGVSLSLWLYYNYRLTGSFFLHPYLKYFNDYQTRTLLWWQEVHEVEYRHPEIEIMLGPVGPGVDLGQRSAWKLFCYLFPLRPVVEVILLILGMVLAWKSSQRIVFLLFALGFCGTALAKVGFPHYVAPYFCAMAILMAAALHWLANWTWRQRALGLGLVCGLVLASAASSVEAFGNMLRARRDVRWMTLLWPKLEYPPYSLNFAPDGFVPTREAVKTELLSRPGPHLVFVLYDNSHNPHEEWVYNGADLATQEIIWARAYTPESRVRLQQHYAKHNCWILEPDRKPWLLKGCDPR